MPLYSYRWEAIWVQDLSPAIQGLLCHDQAPAHPQRSVALPVYHLPGLLPQPGSHAETHEEPQTRGCAPGLEDREDLPVRMLRLSRTYTLRHTILCVGRFFILFFPQKKSKLIISVVWLVLSRIATVNCHYIKPPYVLKAEGLLVRLPQQWKCCTRKDIEFYLLWLWLWDVEPNFSGIIAILYYIDWLRSTIISWLIISCYRFFWGVVCFLHVLLEWSPYAWFNLSYFSVRILRIWFPLPVS